MQLAIQIVQTIIFLGILNVWIIRPKMKTAYRGKGAANLQKEFEAYGLPYPVMLAVGGLKLATAIMLFLGLWFPSFTGPSAIVMASLMFGAIVMHVKVQDSVTRMVPALLMFLMSLFVAIFSFIYPTTTVM